MTTSLCEANCGGEAGKNWPCGQFTQFLSRLTVAANACEPGIEINCQIPAILPAFGHGGSLKHAKRHTQLVPTHE